MRAHRTLLCAALLALAGPAAALESYVDVGLRSISGSGVGVSVAAGVDTAVTRSGLRAGVELGAAAGGARHTLAALTMSYDGRHFAPYVKAGRISGGVRGEYRAIGVEYRSSFQRQGWAAVLEIGKAAAGDSVMSVAARFRF